MKIDGFHVLGGILGNRRWKYQGETRTTIKRLRKLRVAGENKMWTSDTNGTLCMTTAIAMMSLII
jgi:hypothetical protein